MGSLTKFQKRLHESIIELEGIKKIIKSSVQQDKQTINKMVIEIRFLECWIKGLENSNNELTELIKSERLIFEQEMELNLKAIKEVVL